MVLTWATRLSMTINIYIEDIYLSIRPKLNLSAIDNNKKVRGYNMVACNLLRINKIYFPIQFLFEILLTTLFFPTHFLIHNMKVSLWGHPLITWVDFLTFQTPSPSCLRDIFFYLRTLVFSVQADSSHIVLYTRLHFFCKIEKINNIFSQVKKMTWIFYWPPGPLKWNFVRLFPPVLFLD